MNASGVAAALVELPVILSNVSNIQVHDAGPSTLHTTSSRDPEIMSSPTVVGREAGERDPFALRSKVKTDDELNGLRQ